MKSKIKPDKFHFLWIPVLFLLPLLAGCSSGTPETPADFSSGHAKNIAVETFPIEETVPPLPDTFSQEEAFVQMLLFLQEGFRQHKIQNTYTVYFNGIETMNDDRFSCKMLLEDKSGSDAGFCWLEHLTFTYDEETGWYTFKGEYEPVLTQDIFYAYDNIDDAGELLDGSVHEAELSINTDLQTSIRYFADPGPTSATTYFYSPGNHFAGDIKSCIYTYEDVRLDTSITILYPYINTSDTELENLLNEKIHEAFFYGYYDEECLNPEKEMCVSIKRIHKVTRKDEQFLSVLIYEFNSYRFANHPNDWYRGITLSLETGKVLTFRDVVGEDCTVEQLLNSGAFHCMWTWECASDEEQLQSIKDSYLESSLDDFNDMFYLTGDSLGLITHEGRYYTCIEAKFADLGLDEWITTPQEDK